MKTYFSFFVIVLILLYSCNTEQKSQESSKETDIQTPPPKQLSVEEVEAMMKGTINNGEQRQGAISLGSERQYFFEADSGQTIDIRLNSNHDCAILKVYKKMSTKVRVSSTQLLDEKVFSLVSDSTHFVDKPKKKTDYRVLISIGNSVKDSSLIVNYTLDIIKQ